MARPGDPHARVDLLRAAEAVFVERGLRDAKVEDITQRARRSKGSFYLHFESKDDAFREIVETILARLAAIVDAALEAYRSPVDELPSVWLEKDMAIFEFLWSNRDVMRLCLAGGGGAQFGYLIDGFAERAHESSKALLARGVEAGFYREDVDVDLVGLMIAGAYDRLARRVVRSPTKPNLRRWLSEAQRFVLAGIATPELSARIQPS